MVEKGFGAFTTSGTLTPGTLEIYGQELKFLFVLNDRVVHAKARNRFEILLG